MLDYALILSFNYVGSQWTLNGNSYDGLTWFSDTPKPTQTELDALWQPTLDAQAKNNCKQKASELLYATDWTTIPDVADSTNNPYLINQAEFISWRNQIRELAVNPVVDPVFPAQPTPVWA
jgi:hypothetical protein